MSRKRITVKKALGNVMTPDCETIVEFSAMVGKNLVGGLITFRVVEPGQSIGDELKPDGAIRIEVYRTDPNVELIIGNGGPTIIDYRTKGA